MERFQPPHSLATSQALRDPKCRFMVPPSLSYVSLYRSLLPRPCPAGPRETTKECGVQVNARVDKCVQCSLGPQSPFRPIRPRTSDQTRQRGSASVFSPVSPVEKCAGPEGEKPGDDEESTRLQSVTKSNLQDQENDEDEGFHTKENLQEDKDGSSLQEDKDGSSLQEDKDGSSLQENTDGSSLQDDKDRSGLQEDKDRSNLQEDKDRSNLQEDTDGSNLQEDKDRSGLQENKDGSYMPYLREKTSNLKVKRPMAKFLEQKYGFFHCKQCNIRWESAYVWCIAETSKVYYKQLCRGCQCKLNPFRVDPIFCKSCFQTVCTCKEKKQQRHLDMKKPHRQDLCCRCRDKRLPCGFNFI